MKTKRYYLAYGSNLNMAQMAARCPGAVPLGTAFISGHALLFRGSRTGAYLTVAESRDGTVPVGVWSVTEADEIRLDRYEGFPEFYRKEEMTVSYTGLVSGKTRKVKAFIYLMNAGRPPGLPSQFYLDTCRRGYEDFGFDPCHLTEAVRRTLEECHENIRF